MSALSTMEGVLRCARTQPPVISAAVTLVMYLIPMEWAAVVGDWWIDLSVLGVYTCSAYL